MVSGLVFAQEEASTDSQAELPVAKAIIDETVEIPHILVGAGDIANCSITGGHNETADLLETIPGTIYTTGDHAYPSGAKKTFNECYGPTWGRHKDRTRPSPGNHDMRTRKGLPYYDYFGENAGPRGRGYYSYNLGEWHIISLDSDGKANSRSRQYKWLKEDLEQNKTACMLAYWHVPKFSSGAHGNHKEFNDVWELMYEHGVDVIVNGHDHSYERFAPQDHLGRADPERGIREFVVGTGGAGVYRFGEVAANSEVRQWQSYGVLKFSLYSGRYEWEFVTAKGQDFTDTGTGYCEPESRAEAIAASATSN
jgi:3',5'-cyclic AMP phosphodiesterase CpdA